MHPATASWPFRLFFVAGGTVWHEGCRQMHSLAPTLSADAQSGRRGRAESTGGDSWKPDSTPGDSWSPIWPPSCRRGVSLAGGLSPGRQSGRWAVASTSFCRAHCRWRYGHGRYSSRECGCGHMPAPRVRMWPLFFPRVRKRALKPRFGANSGRIGTLAENCGHIGTLAEN